MKVKDYIELLKTLDQEAELFGTTGYDMDEYYPLGMPEYLTNISYLDHDRRTWLVADKMYVV